MSLEAFLKLVQFRTKLTSLFPFLIGCLFAYYRFHAFQPVNILIFFSSMLLFDLAATAINNYMDYRKATSDEYRRRENIIGQENIPEGRVVFMIISFVAVATALGIWLVVRTDLVVLLAGMVCFAIGILYSFGPIPLSRMPLGEIVSGVTEGFGVLFLTVYANAFDKGIANLIWQGWIVIIKADIWPLFEIGLVSVPCMFSIANVMLANNICDLDDDIKNKRFTLVYYIGKKYALWLFDSLYAASFAAILFAVLLHILPPALLLTVLTVIPVYKLVRQFNRVQSKSNTFVVALKSMVLMNSSVVLLLLVAVIF
ncbi:1,4-dihydroxy-2-naphthoate polyprenyltransferase [Sporolactobacillus vineae]|uniref:1,4-dihydroxy-2-naphthoate polyprenyltransferase n=1 Tax=Sporolactobacillus vineae TaxID=444463 RepID=UPI000287F883|nr:1,4-dihydroxy-2-naphthoate polyprenyltransferase [Sporolactobacillus vineae]